MSPIFIASCFGLRGIVFYCDMNVKDYPDRKQKMQKLASVKEWRWISSHDAVDLYKCEATIDEGAYTGISGDVDNVFKNTQKKVISLPNPTIFIIYL